MLIEGFFFFFLKKDALNVNLKLQRFIFLYKFDDDLICNAVPSNGLPEIRGSKSVNIPAVIDNLWMNSKIINQF